MPAKRALVVLALGPLAAGLLVGVPVREATAAPARGPAGAITTGPVATGYGGAVATVDPDATKVGIEVLRRGGNAVDAAVAAAATLGVSEPFSSGIGGGGFFVYYDARSRRVSTVDGRETAPAAFQPNTFVENGFAIPVDQAVTSGLSVGVPGTLQTWSQALRRWGTLPLADALRPAERVAERGFVVDATFYNQVLANQARFADFSSTRALFLPGDKPPPVGSVFRNPDLAATYAQIARAGPGLFYRGELGAEIAGAAQHPPVVPGTTRPIRPGLMKPADLAAYRAPSRAPTHVRYRGLDVHGMAPPSSGGSTVGEALNIVGTFDLADMSSTQYLHHFLEASRLSFADRNRYVGDPGYVDVPLRELLSTGFARERACLIDPARALISPVSPGSPDGHYGPCPAPGAAGLAPDTGQSTTNLTVADRWGNVVEYTLTIEQIGGSGITVPGRGFLLNNELTDFDFVPINPDLPDPNLPAGGKRPRSSMAPTVVLRDGSPYVAVGSPGGATIITTVLQILLNRLDRALSLPAAIAAPRASQRNRTLTDAEPAFAPEQPALEALGHRFASLAEIGAATGVEFLRGGRLLAAAEPVRRGGGAAAVVRPG